MRILLTLSFIGTFFSTSAADEARYSDRWVYAPYNLQVEKNADEVIKLIDRSKKAGFTAIVLADFKLNVLGRVPKHYFTNLARVQKAAEAAGIEIIPTVFPIGYSEGILTHDPNLAEGIPVKDAPFISKNGVLMPNGEPVAFRNGNLEQAKGDKFVGFSYQDDPGMTTFADTKTVHGGKTSCRMDNPTRNCRLTQAVKVRPWTCYRFALWMKTKDFTGGDFKLMAMGKSGRMLTFNENSIESTKDWTEVEVVFNSLGEEEITLYAGVWGGFKGTLWLDDLSCTEMSLVNILRRSGCPLTVASSDGKTIYEEGKDFHPVRDEKLMADPEPGHWGFRHAGPTIRLTTGSRISDWSKVRVSWYHPVVIHWEQVPCSLIEPKVEELMRDQARRVFELFKPKTVMMSHDELRVAGWCQLCEKSGKTPGQLLAANAALGVKILRELDPKVRVAVWSDMFDPHHNALDKYYLVNGSLKGSWEGLPKDVVIVNWNGGKAESLKWFADRGHSQVLAGYYDGDIKNFKTWDAAAKGIPGVNGFMYTTWKHRYEHLEEYGKALQK